MNAEELIVLMEEQPPDLVNWTTAQYNEALALIRELASSSQRFDNVTRSLLALVKPEWKREAQLIIDQFNP